MSGTKLTDVYPNGIWTNDLSRGMAEVKVLQGLPPETVAALPIEITLRLIKLEAEHAKVLRAVDDAIFDLRHDVSKVERHRIVGYLLAAQPE